jgi:uncharacterized protein YndB with AHSA1/START domain
MNLVTTPFELTLTREVPVSAADLYRGWTDPEWLVKWFAPKPWTTASAELNVRVGGSTRVVMKSPEGQEFRHEAVYLEVVPNRRLVSTNVFSRAWEPAILDTDPESCSFSMVMILEFEDLGEKRSRYTARVLHWTEAEMKRHEAMGFQEGWSQCLDQLVALASKGA